MGRASRQRNLSRMKKLAGLAGKDPELFDFEWEKRVSSWLDQIRKDAGVWQQTIKTGKKEIKAIVSPVFKLVDIALETLMYCGMDTYEKYAEETCEILSTECCRQFGIRVDRNFYRLNNYRRPDKAL